MSATIGRNDPCPCGSGTKFKRCCIDKLPARPFTRDDRFAAIAALREFSDEVEAEDDTAYDEFWGELLERDDEIDEQWETVSEDVFDAWFWFDRPLPDGRTVAARLLEQATLLPPGQRRFLEAMRHTCLRLYEVTDVRPGVSVTLRDLFDVLPVTVHEKMASRSMVRGDVFAARIVPRGASGQPEIEIGIMNIPALSRRSLVGEVEALRREFVQEHPGESDAQFFKDIAPLLHMLWMMDILDPPMPHLRNFDGEDLLWTRTMFAVLDRTRLVAALAAAEDLEAGDDGDKRWHWMGVSGDKPISLGALHFAADTLVLETNSAGRGERGRRRLEALAGDAIRHRATTHEDVTQPLQDHARTGQAAKMPEPLPRDQVEELALGMYARHYRSWLDLPVPMLGGRTPRVAAKDVAGRAKVIELVRGLEGQYQKALKADQPAYDPSWMWAELGLHEAGDPLVGVPLAHERWADTVPGLGGLSRSVAQRVRERPDFDDASSLVAADDLDADLQVRRLLMEHGTTVTDAVPLASHVPSTAVVRLWLACMADFELHRRKTFRVDEPLAFLLAQTELDVQGQQVRVPFPCFALVFTDRHVLSLAERLLAADRESPLAGHFVRVLTVYVSEEQAPDHRVLRLRLAPDTQGADPPGLVDYTLVLRPDTQVEPLPVGYTPPGAGQPEQLPDVRPLPGLCHVVLSAILYATSADAVTRPATGPRRSAARMADAGSTPEAELGPEQVFYLPGSIDITGVRRLQELARAPSGRTQLHRFMVRGHWRRALAPWQDQRLRWVAPYWKGPEIALVIERAYRLKA